MSELFKEPERHLRVSFSPKTQQHLQSYLNYVIPSKPESKSGEIHVYEDDEAKRHWLALAAIASICQDIASARKDEKDQAHEASSSEPSTRSTKMFDRLNAFCMSYVQIILGDFQKAISDLRDKYPHPPPQSTEMKIVSEGLDLEPTTERTQAIIQALFFLQDIKDLVEFIDKSQTLDDTAMSTVITNINAQVQATLQTALTGIASLNLIKNSVLAEIPFSLNTSFIHDLAGITSGKGFVPFTSPEKKLIAIFDFVQQCIAPGKKPDFIPVKPPPKKSPSEMPPGP